MSKKAKPYHTKALPLTERPLSANDRITGKPELLNTQLWPKALIGRSLLWAYIGDGVVHRWRVEEPRSDKPGFRLILWGERVWAVVGMTPDQLSERQLLIVLASAIGAAFVYPNPPQLGQEREIEIRQTDFDDLRFGEEIDDRASG